MSRLDEIEKRLDALEKMLTPQRPAYVPQAWPNRIAGDCGCQPNSICGSISCPRALRITCGIGLGISLGDTPSMTKGASNA